METRRLSDLSDDALMALVKENDASAFAVVYERHRRMALAVAVRIVGAEAAEDVVQAGFLTIWRNRESYRVGRGAARSWILAIVRYRAFDTLRATRSGERTRQAHSLTGIALVDHADGQPDTIVVQQDEARSARHALQLLPDTQREVLSLAYYVGLTHSQIAGRLGLPLGTVKSRLRLGLEKLNDALGQGLSV